jgi:oxygen-independent coproporphyrinogen III oxidase
MSNKTVLPSHHVPRYTSYPPATAFDAQVGPAQYATWLGALGAGEKISIYVHVPYCRQLCWYCGCHTKASARDRPIARYVEALAHEIDYVSELLRRRQPVQHIHFGGGTPSILTGQQFGRIMAELNRVFAPTGDAEIAIEIDPRSASQEFVAALAACGVNRASIGVQDFDADVQRAVNRIQPYETVAAAVASLRRAGIAALSFDLIYGLPHQTVASIERTVALTLSLRPDRVALFGYAHLPRLKPHQRLIDERALPDAALRDALFVIAATRLREAGYVAIGLDHFARHDDPLARAAQAGRLHRNFQGYTTDQAGVLLGFGPSAISTFPQGYAQNTPDIAVWLRDLKAGLLPTVRGRILTHDDQRRAAIISQIMCADRVELPEIESDERAALAALAADGVIGWDGAAVELTQKGRSLRRHVAAVFDRYRAANLPAAAAGDYSVSR